MNNLNMNLPKTQNRDYRIDLLKTLAIIAVVLYHFSNRFLPFGYLGVDIFLAVSGFLMLESILRDMENGTFGFFAYLLKRICRLALPVLVGVSFVYFLGYFSALPDAYKIASEHCVAASLFLDNVLPWLLRNNYWNMRNSFAPLMHMWYVGLLMQAYIFIVGLSAICYRVAKKNTAVVRRMLAVLTILSLIAYMYPQISPSTRFYLLPCRIFEMTSGWLIYDLCFRTKEKRITDRKFSVISLGIYVLLCFLLLGRTVMISSSIKLIMVVFATNVLLIGYQYNTEIPNRFLMYLSKIGEHSYSIYICHQIIIAYSFAYLFEERTVKSTWVVFSLIVIGSVIMYWVVEKNVGRLTKKSPRIVLCATVFLSLALAFIGCSIYMDSGVVRDYPELGIEKEDFDSPHREQVWPQCAYEYVDRPKNWSRDFESGREVKVLVIGNSFARDWANILNESHIADSLQISYLESPNRARIQKAAKRIEEADYIFCAEEIGYSRYEKGFPSHYLQFIPKEKLYVVGDKNFGYNNGLIYHNRKKPDYFEQTAIVGEGVLERNKRLENIYGDHFIDLLEPLLDSENRVSVFTDDRKFISWDTRHLTQYGAKYFAKILDLDWIANKNPELGEK